MLGVTVSGCGLFGGSGGHPARQTSPSVTAAPAPTTTIPGIETTGPRTVLSPIGLHVRAAPSLAAKVLGTAGQGVVLEVEGQTGQSGGWYKVRGATITGWISGSPSLSAAGTFRDFTSVVHHFQVLFPLTWSVVDSAASAVFRAPAQTETIVVTTAPTVAKLGQVRAGYRQVRTETLVACGVTGDLNTYAAGGAASGPYYAQIRLALDKQHALGIAASFPDLAGLQPVRNFVNSITFSSPQCQG